MRLYKSFFVLFFLSLATVVSAQDISSIDFQSLNIDNLSDQQIQQVYQQAQERGLSISQITQLAIARGLPPIEANKLQQRLMQVQAGGVTGNMQQFGTSRMRYPPTNFSGLANFGGLLADSASDSLAFLHSPEFRQYQMRQDSIWLAREKLRNKIFGFELFADNTVDFQPSLNIATPEDYRLGPGDELIIDIWGAAQNTYQLEVSPDGMILIPNIGPVNVNGLTIGETSQRLKQRLGEIYSGLNPSDPAQKDTYMLVTLGQVRSIKVTVLGEAQTPGTYTMTSLATVFNALYAAGGPTVNGSFRKIDIIRGDSVIAVFDLYDLLIYGDQSNNIRLQGQDIIQINPYINRVEIEGEVKRPGIYEMRNHESLADLITYTGGFTGEAYTGRIKVISNTDSEKRIADVQKSNFDDYNLKNGDLVTVGEILNRFANLVKIEGAVFRPGPYEVTDSTTLYTLIQRAEGLKEDAFMNRGIIYRTRDNFTIESISFNLRKIMQNPEEYDIPLVKNDIVHISSIFDMRENYTVSISGPVQMPATYDFVYGMTLEDLIFQANGFRESAAPYRIEVARRVRNLNDTDNPSQIAEIFTFSVNENLELQPDDANFILQPFDQVYIRSLPNYRTQNEVSIVGEVKYPGVYTISSKDERISDLIQRAGGLTSEAYLQGAALFREREFTEQESQQTLANIAGFTQEEQQEKLQQQTGNKKVAQVGIDLPEVISNPGSKYDLFIEKGDSLFIPKQLQTVTVKGSVFYPTTIRFDQNKSFEDYITSAGGYTEIAKKKRAYVIYASGKVDRVKNFLFFKDYPEVRPGATIVIPEEPQKDKLTPQERVGIFSAIISTAALITTTIIQITSN